MMRLDDMGFAWRYYNETSNFGGCSHLDDGFFGGAGASRLRFNHAV
jgi:hypothetical protein